MVLVPKAIKIPNYMIIFWTFHKNVWLLLLLFTFLMTIIFYFLGNCRNLQNSIFEVISIIVMNSTHKNLENKWSVKLFTINFIVTSFIICCAFQSSFTSLLVSPKRFNDINTINELERNGLKLAIGSLLQEAKNLNFTLKTEPKEKKELFTMIRKADPRWGFCLKKTYAEIFAKIIVRNGELAYHIVEEELVPGFSSYYFEKNSPYLDEMNKFLLYVEEYGLKFFNMSYFTEKNIYFNNDENVSKLNLKQFQSLFCIFIFGNALGVLVALWKIS